MVKKKSPRPVQINLITNSKIAKELTFLVKRMSRDGADIPSTLDAIWCLNEDILDNDLIDTLARNSYL